MHVALILDGNRRWAKKNSLAKMLGHKRGLENLKKLLPNFIEEQVEWLTIFVLSTENLASRSQSELQNLFQLIEVFGQDLTLFERYQIRVKIFGCPKGLPVSTQKVLKRLTNATKSYAKLNLNLALNYGGQAEIVRAAQKLQKNGQKISIANFAQALDSRGQPEPDLLIRTGGQKRLSNFLPWQMVYTELYFLAKMWPEFQAQDLKKALNFYHRQKRNFGK